LSALPRRMICLQLPGSEGRRLCCSRSPLYTGQWPCSGRSSRMYCLRSWSFQGSMHCWARNGIWSCSS